MHGNKKVKELLKRQFVSLIKLETTKDFSKLDLMLSLEFFRTIILHTSKVSKAEVSRTIDELTENKKPSVELVSQMLYNGILALQFSKNAVARDKYMKALELYQTLPPKVQAKVYDELVLDFQHLAYASTFQ